MIIDTGLEPLLVGLSLANAVLSFWLGTTVLLNADRQTWGVWLSGGGLLASGLFFAAHTLLVAWQLFPLLDYLNVPMVIGWVPVIGLPFAWYLAMLWFAGFFEPASESVRGHRYVLPIVLVALLAVVTLLFVEYLSVEERAIRESHPRSRGSEGFRSPAFPALAFVYPIYLLLCYGASFDLLRRPIPVHGIAYSARDRARPWLRAGTLLQVAVSIVIGIALVGIVSEVSDPALIAKRLLGQVWVDLLLLIIVSLALFSLGEAVVTYEIFTGQILPRGGFRRRWRGTLILAAVCGLFGTVAFGFDVPAIYPLVAFAIGLAVQGAILHRRSYVERERYLAQLGRIVGASTMPSSDVGHDDRGRYERSFAVLCEEGLNASRAWLVPSEGTATLIGPTIAFPGDAPFPDTAQPPAFPEEGLRRLTGDDGEEIGWSVGLHPQGASARLLVGPKRDGSPYTREEIDIARTACERLIEEMMRDELARRLARLQRRRLAESRVIDSRTRRALHDDVLPRIHAAMLSLSGTSATPDEKKELTAALAEAHGTISDLLRELPSPENETLAKLGLAEAIRRVAEREHRDDFSNVSFVLTEEGTRAAGAIPPLTSEVVYAAVREAVRNAARHGNGGDVRRNVQLRVTIHGANDFVIEIEDDGVGFDPSQRLPGHGLELHGTLLAVVGGSLGVELRREGGTKVTFRVPVEHDR